MKLYRKKMEFILRTNRQKVEQLERHRDFYPLIEELCETFEREFWPNQLSNYLYISVYLEKKDDKTLPLLMEEFILSHTWIEEDKPSISHKEQGEINFFFQLSNPYFGSKERPKLNLCVNYSDLCKRVVTGTRLVEDYEYKCD